MISKIKLISSIAATALILGFSGCGGAAPNTHSLDKQNSQNSLDKQESLKNTKKTISIFNQELELPEQLSEGSVKLYPSNRLKGKLGEAWYVIPDIRLGIQQDTFVFDKTRSRRFQFPYYAVSFKNPMVINSVLVYHDAEVYNDKKKKIEAIPNIYLLKINGKIKEFYPYPKTHRYYNYTVDETVDPKSGVKIDKINFDTQKPTKNLYIAFNNIDNVSKTKYIDVKKKPTIKVDGYSIEDVVLKALKDRTDKEYNEELVREVGFKNPSVFRAIQRNSKKLNLPQTSVANFPIDISIDYALKNSAKIIKTGLYKSKNGTFKNYKNTIVFDDGYKYKSNNKVKVNDEKVSMKKSGSSHKKDDYIDFSQGI